MIKVIDGLKTYYEVIGNGQPLLLLHGWGNSSDTMRPIAMLAKEYDYRVYSIDLPGFGFSDSPPTDWSVRNYMEFVIKFLDIYNLNRVDIISHSFGGRITIMLSAIFPDRVGKIALVNSAGIKPKHNLKYYISVFSYKIFKVLLKFLYNDSYNSKLLIKKLGSADYRNAGNLRGTLVKVINEDLEEYLPMIKAQTLLIWGELDNETPLSDGYIMHNLLPDSELKIINNAGHHSFIDHQNEFNSIIISSFLEKN